MIKDKSPYRIMIIENYPEYFTRLVDLLTEQIEQPLIIHAENFSMAAAILSIDPIMDVILLDLALPDKCGEHLITYMLQNALCPVIILTDYKNIDFSIHSISQGISGYLLKSDLNKTILYKSITDAIERKYNVNDLSKLVLSSDKTDKVKYIRAKETQNIKLQKMPLRNQAMLNIF